MREICTILSYWT